MIASENNFPGKQTVNKGFEAVNVTVGASCVFQVRRYSVSDFRTTYNISTSAARGLAIKTITKGLVWWCREAAWDHGSCCLQHHCQWKSTWCSLNHVHWWGHVLKFYSCYAANEWLNNKDPLRVTNTKDGNKMWPIEEPITLNKTVDFSGFEQCWNPFG